jgi:hypothetical protein
MKANTGDGTEQGNDDEHRALHMACKLEERSLASVQNIHVRYQTLKAGSMKMITVF